MSEDVQEFYHKNKMGTFDTIRFEVDEDEASLAPVLTLTIERKGDGVIDIVKVPAISISELEYLGIAIESMLDDLSVYEAV